MAADPDNNIRLPRQRTMSSRYMEVGLPKDVSFRISSQEREDWYNETPHKGVRLAVYQQDSGTPRVEAVVVMSPQEVDDLIVALSYYKEKGVIKDETTEE